MGKLIAVLIILCSTPAYADEWTEQDTVFEIAYQTLALMDWGQTRDIAKNPDRYYEETNNRILGRYPQLRDVDVYMPLAMLGHYIISKDLPKEWHNIPVRTLWQSITIGFKSSLVDKNIRIGLKVNF